MRVLRLASVRVWKAKINECYDSREGNALDRSIRTGESEMVVHRGFDLRAKIERHSEHDQMSQKLGMTRSGEG